MDDIAPSEAESAWFSGFKESALFIAGYDIQASDPSLLFPSKTRSGIHPRIPQRIHLVLHTTVLGTSYSICYEYRGRLLRGRRAECG